MADLTAITVPMVWADGTRFQRQCQFGRRTPKFPQTDCGLSGNIRNDNASLTKFI